MNSQRLSIAVTGAGGFIGSALVSTLAHHRNVREVRALYEHHYQVPQQDPANTPDKTALTAIVGDLRGVETARKTVHGADCVLHLASMGFPSDAVNSYSQQVADNILIAGSPLEAMKEQGVKRMIFPGSGGGIYKAHSVNARPFKGDDTIEFRSSYALYKIACENLITFCGKQYDISPVILRISNPYGPGQFGRSRQGFLGVAFEKSLRNEPMPIWGSLETCKDFIYIQDVISAFESFIFLPGFPTGIYNVGSNQGTTLREALTCLQNVTGVRLKLETLPHKQTDCRWAVLDTRKITETTGWKCGTSLEDGLTKCWQEVKNTHKSIYRAA